jgi:cobalamin biosynthesis protein CobD/CbiB
MIQNFVGRWGFIVAGILFLIAAILPFLAGEKFNVTFFVISVALLLIATAIARKHADGRSVQEIVEAGRWANNRLQQSVRCNQNTMAKKHPVRRTN